MKNNYVLNNETHIFYAFSRNPYDRIISAYFYKFNNLNKSISDFQHFIINELNNYNFKDEFNKYLIHFYPQYLFVCNENYNIENVIVKKIEEKINPPNYDMKKYFTDDVLKIINKIYENDFLFFNYSIIENTHRSKLI